MFAIYNFIYTVYYIYNISFSNEVLTTDHLYGSNNRTIISVNLKPCIQLTSCFTGDETWSLHTSVNIYPDPMEWPNKLELNHKCQKGTSKMKSNLKDIV